MSDEASKSVDLLGLKPVSDSVLKLTSAVVDGVAGFLDKICSPVAKEYGLLLKDKVKAWRAENAARLLAKAKEKVEANTSGDENHADPRTVFSILENGSWIEDSVVQDLWAGLLASSCTKDGDDDSNLIFTNLLGQMTKLQARILLYVCKTVDKRWGTAILITAGETHVSLSELSRLFEEPDHDRLDREVAGLVALGLLNGGVLRTARGDIVDPVVRMQPLTLALNMYVRCQGSRKSVAQFFGLAP